MTHDGGDALVQAEGIVKAFGAVQALRGARLTIARGQSVGIAGHNGAGKSTLMNILCGTLAPDAGSLRLAGQAVAAPGTRWDVREARRLGVRRVFQELSLCDNLTLAENMHIAQPGAGLGWRRRAGDALLAMLDAIFPGHGLRPGQVVGDLAIGQRQAVEIARAFVPDAGALADPLALMILDEPTSSLDHRAADQLLAYIRRFVATGGSCVLITHKLDEIFKVTDRVLAMRDGLVVDDVATADSSRDRLVAAMGQEDEQRPGGGGAAVAASLAPVVVRASLSGSRSALEVRRGEVVGLAGLAGHGQTELLVALQRAGGKASVRGAQISVSGEVAFVAGDRQTDGVFPLWSIERNMSLGWLAGLTRRGLIDPAAERRQVLDWRQRLGLVTPDVVLPVLSLSGGNQQKVLFARALGSAAEVVLMDDPMRGVDVGTKHDVYGLIAAEARQGRSFVWYSTEFDELFQCDRVYVFNSDRIVGELARAEISEERVLQLSFAEAVA